MIHVNIDYHMLSLIMVCVIDCLLLIAIMCAPRNVMLKEDDTGEFPVIRTFDETAPPPTPEQIEILRGMTPRLPGIRTPYTPSRLLEYLPPHNVYLDNTGFAFLTTKVPANEESASWLADPPTQWPGSDPLPTEAIYWCQIFAVSPGATEGEEIWKAVAWYGMYRHDGFKSIRDYAAIHCVDNTVRYFVRIMETHYKWYVRPTSPSQPLPREWDGFLPMQMVIKIGSQDL